MESGLYRILYEDFCAKIFQGWRHYLCQGTVLSQNSDIDPHMAIRERTKQKGKPQRCCLRKSASHKVNLLFHVIFHVCGYPILFFHVISHICECPIHILYLLTPLTSTITFPKFRDFLTFPCSEKCIYLSILVLILDDGSQSV